MGYYTKLNINVSLRYDTPKEVIDIIEYMFYKRDDEPKYDYPILKTKRLRMMVSGDSSYFMGNTTYKFTKPYDSEGYYKLSINSNIKNYDNEYELFLEMIAPYIVYDEFIVYIIGEDEEIPRLLYARGNVIIEER